MLLRKNNMIYIFRGKAATGKTTLTDMLSRELHIPVFRKDDFFDVLTEYDFETGLLNNMSYNLLTKVIQTNIDLNNNVIIDIGLCHKPYIIEFINKINFRNKKVFNFLCVCSDDEVWKERINARIKNPAPNQKMFKTLEQVMSHYNSCDISPLENEIVIDSANNINGIFQNIMDIIN